MNSIKIIKKTGSPAGVPVVTGYINEPNLPIPSADDTGKVLIVNTDGQLTYGSAGGGDLYVHHIAIVHESGLSISIDIINGSNIAFTSTTLAKFIYDLGYTSTSNYFFVNSAIVSVDVSPDKGVIKIATGLYSTNGTTIRCAGTSLSPSIVNSELRYTKTAVDWISVSLQTDTIYKIN